MGYADFETNTIVLSANLSQAERRATCWHEVMHLLRGPVPGHLTAREERKVEALVARDLIPFDALVDAMLWSESDREIAEELSVDVETVRARLFDLTEAESAELNRRLDEAEARFP
jgi:Zn-dependent peptidase ImmA (M78 family)